MLRCVAVCCGVLRCVVVCCSVLRRIAVCCSIRGVCVAESRNADLGVCVADVRAMGWKKESKLAPYVIGMCVWGGYGQ